MPMRATHSAIRDASSNTLRFARGQKMTLYWIVSLAMFTLGIVYVISGFVLGLWIHAVFGAVLMLLSSSIPGVAEE